MEFVFCPTSNSPSYLGGNSQCVQPWWTVPTSKCKGGNLSSSCPLATSAQGTCSPQQKKDTSVHEEKVNILCWCSSQFSLGTRRFSFNDFLLLAPVTLPKDLLATGVCLARSDWELRSIRANLSVMNMNIRKISQPPCFLNEKPKTSSILSSWSPNRVESQWPTALTCSLTDLVLFSMYSLSHSPISLLGYVRLLSQKTTCSQILIWGSVSPKVRQLVPEVVFWSRPSGWDSGIGLLIQHGNTKTSLLLVSRVVAISSML